MLTASRGKAVLLLLLAALVGAGLGSLVTGWGFGRHGPGRGHWRGPERYVRMLDRELKLSPAQEDSIRAILERSSGRMDSLWREMRPRVDSFRAAIRAEIRSQLSAEQQAQYGRLTERLDSARRQRE